ncbi:MAG: hypothetical protein A4E69_00456 [Syntrophus sp. PtaB.Bin138]|nr:MAG: hypothetical protein A4E69_00456 [Syntrophus sp. PtaB.Bin138]
MLHFLPKKLPSGAERYGSCMEKYVQGDKASWRAQKMHCRVSIPAAILRAAAYGIQGAELYPAAASKKIFPAIRHLTPEQAESGHENPATIFRETGSHSRIHIMAHCRSGRSVRQAYIVYTAVRIPAHDPAEERPGGEFVFREPDRRHEGKGKAPWPGAFGEAGAVQGR